jgi:ABC-type polysaccharide/polyol phosphate transport system ATPase subunit
MGVAVRIDDLSVRFVLQHQRPRSFQEAVVSLFRRHENTTEEFWALRNINLEVQEGETVGIIGQNGSGKSTLLKLITRILEPTRGCVSVNGKVSALIELGAGFHPDLTGRENIYLNGSILGYSRKAMDRLFDEIVAFSELERFIDTPVKHYSSGMYARLGFSVAISVDPEILIIDEVLSVGDEAFQQKCLGRIDRCHQRGATILLVSHSLDVIEKLCGHVIWMDQGRIKAQGTPEQMIDRYRSGMQLGDAEVPERPERLVSSTLAGPTSESLEPKPLAARLYDVSLLSVTGESVQSIRSGDSLIARIEYRIDESADWLLQIAFCRDDGLVLYRTSKPLTGQVATAHGETIVKCVIFDHFPVLAGGYEIRISLAPTDEYSVLTAELDRRVPLKITGKAEACDAGILALGSRWVGDDDADWVGPLIRRVRCAVDTSQSQFTAVSAAAVPAPMQARSPADVGRSSSA